MDRIKFQQLQERVKVLENQLALSSEAEALGRSRSRKAFDSIMTRLTAVEGAASNKVEKIKAKK